MTWLYMISSPYTQKVPDSNLKKQQQGQPREFYSLLSKKKKTVAYYPIGNRLFLSYMTKPDGNRLPHDNEGEQVSDQVEHQINNELFLFSAIFLLIQNKRLISIIINFECVLRQL